MNRTELTVFRAFLIVATAAVCWLLAGCATSSGIKSPKRLATDTSPYTAVAERIATDPVSYLRGLARRCEQLDQYRLTFYRQERLGLAFPRLGEMERIEAAFRKEPFSVKFVWPDESNPYYESVYVAGQNDNKLIVRERKGFLNFPPQVRVLNVEDPVKWGRSKNPITNFGLARACQRILALYNESDLAGELTTTYEGIVDLEPMHRPAHHIRIRQEPSPGHPHTQRDFYIDAVTDLPAGVDLWLKPDRLDARYRYTDVRTDVQLTDADFRLSQDHPDLSGKAE
jgi:hypothetical protein